MPIGICVHTFKVRPENKAVGIPGCLVAQVQEESWWVVRFN